MRRRWSGWFAPMLTAWALISTAGGAAGLPAPPSSTLASHGAVGGVDLRRALAVVPGSYQVYGPYWVTLAPGVYCSVAKLYLQGFTLFGTEVGCPSELGSLYIGEYDPSSGTIYLSEVQNVMGGAGMYIVFLDTGAVWLQVAAWNAGLPATYGPWTLEISLSPPAGAGP